MYFSLFFIFGGGGLRSLRQSQSLYGIMCSLWKEGICRSGKGRTESIYLAPEGREDHTKAQEWPMNPLDLLSSPTKFQFHQTRTIFTYSPPNDVGGIWLGKFVHEPGRLKTLDKGPPLRCSSQAQQGRSITPFMDSKETWFLESRLGRNKAQEVCHSGPPKDNNKVTALTHVDLCTSIDQSEAK